MTNYWGVRFDARGGRAPTLDELPRGTFGLWDPLYRRWFIMWPSP